MLYNALAELFGGNFLHVETAHFGLDLIDELLDLLGRNGRLVTGYLYLVEQFTAIKRLAPTVGLNNR